MQSHDPPDGSNSMIEKHDPLLGILGQGFRGINNTNTNTNGSAKPNSPSGHGLAVIVAYRRSCRLSRLSLEQLCMVVAALANGTLDILETLLCEKLVDANNSPDDAPAIAPVVAPFKAVTYYSQTRYLSTSSL